MRSKPPFRVTVLIWLVLWLAVWNGLRLWTAITWRERLAEFAPRPGPLYIGATGALWTAAGLFALWALWSGKPWTRRLIAVLAAAYTAWYWADRLLFQQERPNAPFILAANILIILFITFALRSGFFSERGS